MAYTSAEHTDPADELSAIEHDVVIVGAGFAGLYAAKQLGRSGVDVLLLDQNNYHQFQPLLYQAATAQIAISTVARPLRGILRRQRDHVTIRTARVASVDAAAKTVTTDDGLSYRGRILVLATGSEPNFFDTPGAAELAYPLYSVDDATSLSSALLGALERAAATRDAAHRQGTFAVVVVGAGPNGVETAGAVAENIKFVVSEYYSEEFAASQCEVHLVDMVDTVLPPFSERSQKYTRRSLEELGVRIHLGRAVSSVSSSGVTLEDDTELPAAVVIWTAGLKGSGLLEPSGLTTGRGGRVDVQPDLTAPDMPGVYVLGDAANITDTKGRALPQLGSVAKQSGIWAADNIRADLEGRPRRPFRFRDMGVMAMVGRGHAIAEVSPRRFQIQGMPAFLAWLGVHLVLLSGWSQRASAVISWFRDYLTRSRPQVVVHQPDEYARARRHGPTETAGPGRSTPTTTAESTVTDQYSIERLYGAIVYDSAGEKIGRTGTIYLDDRTGDAAFVSVSTGLFGASESLVPLQDARLDDQDLRVGYTKDQVKHAPRIDGGRQLSADEEARLYDHYQLEHAAGTATPSGIRAMSTPDDSQPPGHLRLRQHIRGQD